jgi:hypothetical protein
METMADEISKELFRLFVAIPAPEVVRREIVVERGGHWHFSNHPLNPRNFVHPSEPLQVT